MLSLIFAAALLQATPDPAPAAPAPKSSTLAATQANGLPKGDYELVAWCHGALAGQLELDPIAKADMEKIEGKAKVEARAKGDAELAAERRQYLKDYEHALAAAEAASPVAIHAKGVSAEEQGYKLWNATRNKEPIWRMLDWGMWDPNDAGCGDAAKRLYDKSKLFGMALKGSDDAPAQTEASRAQEIKADETKVEDAKIEERKAEEAKADDKTTALPVADAVAAPPSSAPATGEATEAVKTEIAPAASDAVAKETAPAPVKKKPAARTAKAKPMAKPVAVSATAPIQNADTAPPSAPATGEDTGKGKAEAEVAPDAPDSVAKDAAQEPVKKKPAVRTAKAKTKAKSAEAIRAELEKSTPTAAPDATAPPTPATDKPAEPTDAPKLRGRE